MHMLLISIFGLDDCPTTAMCCKTTSVASTKISSMNIPLNNFGAKVLDILYFFEEVAKNSSDS